MERGEEGGVVERGKRIEGGKKKGERGIEREKGRGRERRGRERSKEKEREKGRVLSKSPLLNLTQPTPHIYSIPSPSW